ncbi:MAG: hypothetical protein DRJ37_06775 [Thermoprotei archaeon]|nr:MAG: hypothetical protein DRJ37_06775 [Thermoprotei archaeon]
MASNEYDALLDELKGLILSKGTLKASEIISWASSKNVGDVVLTLLVKDAIDELDVEIVGEVVLDKDLNLTIPREIHFKETVEEQKSKPREKPLTYLIVEEKKAPPKRGRAVKRKKRRKERRRGAPITEFFKVAPEEPSSRKEEGSVEKERLIEGEKAEKVHLPPLSDDVIKAITYLSEYWSVGEIRFIEDLKRMGVKNPREVIRELLKLGYIERKPLGVINATEKMPRIKPKSYLSDVL